MTRGKARAGNRTVTSAVGGPLAPGTPVWIWLVGGALVVTGSVIAAKGARRKST
ncbi:hypothetical protein SAMN05444920_13435 [Nonomuraea solani]|uniref:Uncharacterized protein n=1 Tax=Nonomuraea solani TaxID=1144553 RepID=A0A1H6F1J0_9ACTN|nr:hypothetical protein [Nonomuraea solani]SEH03231.1 hypothetical protein SAMN05444920_13435 [Nonomuraea solani]